MVAAPEPSDILAAFHRHSANPDLAMGSIRAMGYSPAQVRTAISELVDEDMISFTEAGWLKRQLAGCTASDMRANAEEDYHERLLRKNPHLRERLELLDDPEHNPYMGNRGSLAAEAAVAFWEGGHFESKWDDVRVLGPSDGSVEATEYELGGHRIARLERNAQYWKLYLSNGGYATPFTHDTLNKIISCGEFYCTKAIDRWKWFYTKRGQSYVSIHQGLVQRSVVEGEEGADVWKEEPLPTSIDKAIAEKFYLRLPPVDYAGIVREASKAVKRFLANKEFDGTYFFVDHGNEYSDHQLQAGYRPAIEKSLYNNIRVVTIHPEEHKLIFFAPKRGHWGFPLSQISHLGKAVLDQGKEKYPVLADFEMVKLAHNIAIHRKGERGAWPLERTPTIHLDQEPRYKPKPERKPSELELVDEQMDELEREFNSYLIEHPDAPKEYLALAALVGKEEEYLKLLSRRQELEWTKAKRKRKNPQVRLEMAKGIKVLCPVTECFTTQCVTCLLMRGASAQAVDCMAKKGHEYHLLFDDPMPVATHNDWNTRVVDPDNPPYQGARMIKVTSRGGD